MFGRSAHKLQPYDLVAGLIFVAIGAAAARQAPRTAPIPAYFRPGAAPPDWQLPIARSGDGVHTGADFMRLPPAQACRQVQDPGATRTQRPSQPNVNRCSAECRENAGNN